MVIKDEKCPISFYKEYTDTVETSYNEYFGVLSPLLK
jgi:hypothetical protein